MRQLRVKAVLKKIYYQLLALLGLYRIGRYIHRHQALILTYHGVLRRSSDVYMNRNCVDAAMFDRQMDFMVRHYNVVSLSDLVQWLSVGKRLPPYTAAITFDDGFRNNFTVALPILRKHRLPATVFLATSFVDSDELGLWTEQVDRLIHRAEVENIQIAVNGVQKLFPLRTRADREVASDQIRAYLKSLPPKQRESLVMRLAEQIGVGTLPIGARHSVASQQSEFGEQTAARAEERYAFLTWQQVETMARSQITFGSHSHTHAILAPLSDEEANFELSESRRLIEEHLGTECRLFSYPNGTEADFGPRDQNLLCKLGYAAAVSQVDGFNDASTSLVALRRINIVRNEDFSFFLAKISGVWSLLKHLQNRVSLTDGRQLETNAV
jgi:peptidoglycan/xylan/chitin deacetylase (PgdA/CDA1 family)